MRDGLQRRRRSRGLSVPKMPPLDSLKLQFHCHHHHHHNLKQSSLPINDTLRTPKVPRGSHPLCPRYSHPFSKSLFLSRFLLLIALIPFYLAYIAETPLSTSICFLLGQFWFLALNFQWLKIFFESLIKATRNRKPRS